MIEDGILEKNYFKIFKPDLDLINENFFKIYKNIIYLVSSSESFSAILYYEGDDYRYAISANESPIYLYYENIVPGKFYDLVSIERSFEFETYGFSRNYYIPFYPKHDIFSDLYYLMEKRKSKFFMISARRKFVFSKLMVKKFSDKIKDRNYRKSIERKMNSDLYHVKIISDINIDVLLKDPFTGQSIIKNGKELIMDPFEISYFMIPPLKNNERRRFTWK
jgi:hypothetical protein